MTAAKTASTAKRLRETMMFLDVRRGAKRPRVKAGAGGGGRRAAWARQSSASDLCCIATSTGVDCPALAAWLGLAGARTRRLRVDVPVWRCREARALQDGCHSECYLVPDKPVYFGNTSRQERLIPVGFGLCFPHPDFYRARRHGPFQAMQVFVRVVDANSFTGRPTAFPFRAPPSPPSSRTSNACWACVC